MRPSSHHQSGVALQPHQPSAPAHSTLSHSAPLPPCVWSGSPLNPESKQIVTRSLNFFPSHYSHIHVPPAILSPRRTSIPDKDIARFGVYTRVFNHFFLKSLCNKTAAAWPAGSYTQVPPGQLALLRLHHSIHSTSSSAPTSPLFLYTLGSTVWRCFWYRGCISLLVFRRLCFCCIALDPFALAFLDVLLTSSPGYPSSTISPTSPSSRNPFCDSMTSPMASQRYP